MTNFYLKLLFKPLNSMLQLPWIFSKLAFVNKDEQLFWLLFKKLNPSYMQNFKSFWERELKDKFI